MKYTIPAYETFNSNTNEFETYPEVSVELNHTLKHLDMWESKYRKRLLGNKEVTLDEYKDYLSIACGTDLTNTLQDNRVAVDMITKLLKDVPSATVIPKSSGGISSRDKHYTSELLYAYMYIYKIDNSWEHKNLNKLLLLISSIANIKNPPKKMSNRESAEEQRAVIAKRRAEAEERMRARIAVQSNKGV